jgi:hypothetical protein
MASLDEIIVKIPRPVLVFVVFAVVIALIMYSNPLKNGCDVHVSNFTKDVSGVLINTRNTKKKMVLAEVSAFKDFCKRGNSQGACENYLNALQKVSRAFVSFDDQCLPQLIEQEDFMDSEGRSGLSLRLQLMDGLKMLSLLAWGEAPPDPMASQLGWLSTTEVYTFCRFKNVLTQIIEPEDYQKFEESVIQLFPAAWPDKYKTEAIPEDAVRPTAYKWSGNPTGTMSRDEIKQRSLLSLRCDAYL